MGRRQIRKGKRVEYLIRDLLRQLGTCERVPCSGNARAIKHDLVWNFQGRTFSVEVKARKDFATLYSFVLPSLYSSSNFSSNSNNNNNSNSKSNINSNSVNSKNSKSVKQNYNKTDPDFVVLKADRKPPLVLMTLERFVAILQELSATK